jgi:hypothetical protein
MRDLTITVPLLADLCSSIMCGVCKVYAAHYKYVLP